MVTLYRTSDIQHMFYMPEFMYLHSICTNIGTAYAINCTE